MTGDRHLLLARPLPPAAGGGWLAVDLRGGARTWQLTETGRTPAEAPGALLVAGPGAVTASQAALSGRRVPVPVAGPGWALAAATLEPR